MLKTNMKMSRFLFLFCLLFILTNAKSQNIKKWRELTFEDKLEMIGMRYTPHGQYTFFELNNYASEDYNCPLYRLGYLCAKLKHEDGQCQIMPFVSGAGHGPAPGNPSWYTFARIRSDFRYGGDLGSASELDTEDLKIMLYYYPQDSAKAIFNTDYMICYPIDMKRKKHENEFTRTRCIVTWKNGSEIFLYFVLTDKGMRNFNKYLWDFQGTLWFKD